MKQHRHLLNQSHRFRVHTFRHTSIMHSPHVAQTYSSAVNHTFKPCLAMDHRHTTGHHHTVRHRSTVHQARHHHHSARHRSTHIATVHLIRHHILFLLLMMLLWTCIRNLAHHTWPSRVWHQLYPYHEINSNTRSQIIQMNHEKIIDLNRATLKRRRKPKGLLRWILM